MTTEVSNRLTDSPVGGAAGVVTRLTIRRTWRGGLAVAAAVVLVTVTAVIGYVAAYPDPADRVTLASSIGANPGLTALFGETRQLETVAGFTEWRVVLILAVTAAVWALFAVTRVLRGEEDTGRADILLAGPVTRTGATMAALTGLGLVLATALVLSALGLAVGAGGDLGRDRSVLLAMTIFGTPAVMVGVGAVTSQVVNSRRRAVTLGAAALGAAYLVRVVADSSADRAWLRWATPLGWLETAHPLTEPRMLPIALSYALALLLCLAAVALVRVRDTGAGLLAASGGRRSRTRGLGGPLGLAVRSARGAAWSWAIGLGLFGVLIGLVARTAAEAMADSTAGGTLVGLGLQESGTLAYVGVLFLILAVALAAMAAGRVAAIRDEEATGRLDAVLVRPITRSRWLSGQAVVGLGVLVLGAASAVLGTWVAGQAGDLGVGFPDLARAGANAVPAACFVLGLGILLFGLVPRAAVTLTYSYVAAAFLMEFVGSAVALPVWLLDLSVLHHVRPVPAVAADVGSAAVLLVGGAVLTLVGVVAFGRRDVAGD